MKRFLAALGAASAAAFAVSVGAEQRTLTPAAQMLSRGITLYSTDSATTEAESLFQQVLKMRPLDARDEESAQYYLGRYYQRNYYMLNRRDGLERAADLFKRIHLTTERDRRPRRWYAESRFYKGLAYLELAKWKDAAEAVDHLEPSLDSTVEIDYLVWGVYKRSLNTRVVSADVKQAYAGALSRFRIGSKKEGQRDPGAVTGIVNALQSSFEMTKLKRRSD